MSRKPVWFEIYAKDIDRAREFYGRVFGWKLEPFADYDPTNYYLLKDRVGHSVAGAVVRRGSVPGLTNEGPGASVVYLEVTDLEATVSAAVEAGGTILFPPRAIGDDGGFFVIITDPEGAPLGLWSGQAGGEM